MCLFLWLICKDFTPSLDLKNNHHENNDFSFFIDVKQHRKGYIGSFARNFLFSGITYCYDVLVCACVNLLRSDGSTLTQTTLNNEFYSTIKYYI